MSTFKPRAGLLSLPVELLLQISEHVFGQQPDAGFMTPIAPVTGLTVDREYSSTACLDLLLVCRRFRDELTKVAFRHTVFIVSDGCYPSSHTLEPLQRHQMHSLRNVVLLFEPDYYCGMIKWRWPFNTKTVNLNTLTVAFDSVSTTDPAMWDELTTIIVTDTVEFLRRLEHVERVKFVQNGIRFSGGFRNFHNKLVGKLLKEDHYQRYDAPGAPHIEATWWDWQSNDAQESIEFFARPAKAMVPELDCKQTQYTSCRC